MIYLDYAAATPMSSHALDIYGRVARHYFANTHSLHDPGEAAAQLLDNCREQIARHLHGDARGLFFTSGGSESNKLAIEGLARTHGKKSAHLIYVQGEHASIARTFEKLRREGFSVTVLPRDQNGVATPDMIERALRKDTLLVSVDHANNEIGSVHDIEAIGRLLHQKGVLFHCDAVQSYGKLPIDVRAARISALTIAAHKIGGPKGVGACYIDPAIGVRPPAPGSPGLPGTVNLPGIAAFAAASEDACPNAPRMLAYIKQLRQRFIDGLKNNPIPVIIEESQGRQLPHILALRIPGIEGQQVMLAANRHGLAVATGSACSSADQRPSDTLLSVGRSADEARELVRLSFADTMTEQDIDQAADRFADAVRKLLKPLPS